MEASSIAHEQREEAKHKTVLLRERAEKDLAQYATDIKDLQEWWDTWWDVYYSTTKNQDIKYLNLRFSRYLSFLN